MRYFFFLVLSVAVFYSCSNKTNCPGEGSASLKQVSVYTNDSIVAAAYYSCDTNRTELAKALWHEKNKLIAGKDSATVYYLVVFNKLKHTPDISADYNLAWNSDMMTYRLCTMDNGFGFVRFCYGVRFDEGRIGDWAYFREVNKDGSLTEVH